MSHQRYTPKAKDEAVDDRESRSPSPGPPEILNRPSAADPSPMAILPPRITLAFSTQVLTPQRSERLQWPKTTARRRAGGVGIGTGGQKYPKRQSEQDSERAHSIFLLLGPVAIAAGPKSEGAPQLCQMRSRPTRRGRRAPRRAARICALSVRARICSTVRDIGSTATP